MRQERLCLKAGTKDCTGMPLRISQIKKSKEKFCINNTQTWVFSVCCDALIVRRGKLGPGCSVVAFCRQRDVYGSIQNGCCLNRLGEFERGDANS